MSPLLLGLIALVLAAIGVLGVIIPVLPGTLFVWFGLAVWSLGHRSPIDWTLLGGGGVVLAAGWVAGALLTKSELARRDVPRWPLSVGAAGGMVGMILLPGPGLVVGFLAGLFLSELTRVGDARAALSTSWVALRTMGLAMLIELACDFAVITALFVRVAMVAA